MSHKDPGPPQSIEIYVNQQSAKTAARWQLVYIGIVISAVLWIGLTSKINLEDKAANIVLSVVFGWLAIFFARGTLFLSRLSGFDGPLYRLDADGVTDYLPNPAKRYSWPEIKHVRWQPDQTGKILAIVPRGKTLNTFARRVLGDVWFGFPSQYLNVSHALLSDFLTRQAPVKVVR